MKIKPERISVTGVSGYERSPLEEDPPADCHEDTMDHDHIEESLGAVDPFCAISSQCIPAKKPEIIQKSTSGKEIISQFNSRFANSIQSNINTE